MKAKFDELRKVPRGTKYNSDVNSIARDAISDATKDSDAISLFNDADENKWFGEWIYPDPSNPEIKIQFSRGIFTIAKILIRKGKASFWMSIKNDNVDFGKNKVT